MAVRYNKLWENLNRQEDEKKRLARSGTHYALSDDETCKR